MKKWVLFPLVTFLFSTPLWATEHAKLPQSFFITHEQFMSLTNAEQKTYVKKLKEMVNEMGSSFPYIAAEMSARSSLFAQLWEISNPSAFGEDPLMKFDQDDNANEVMAMGAIVNARAFQDKVYKARLPGLTKEQKEILVEEYRQSLYWNGLAASAAHKIKDPARRDRVLNTVKEDSAKGVISNEDKIKIIADEKEMAELRKIYYDKALTSGLSLSTSQYPNIDHPDQKLKPKAYQPTETAAVTAPISQQQSEAPPQKPEASKEKPPVEKDKKPEVALPVPVPPGKMAPTEADSEDVADGYRCMYAGFVIKKGPKCIAPRELPWNLQGLGEDFACEKGKVMCNPFVFGFKSDCGWAEALDKGSTDKCWSSAKPFCVKPNLYATQNCTDISKTDDALQAAVELIKKNEDTYNSLGNSFDELCNKDRISFNSYPYPKTAKNKERTKRDIKRTCEVASKRMKEIEARYGKGEEKPKSILSNQKNMKGTDYMQIKKGPPTGADLLMKKPGQNSGQK